jgi:hypothetical protein
MKLMQLTETYSNLFLDDKAQRQKYAQQLFNMLTVAYESIGGIKGSGFNSPQDMVDVIPMWKLSRQGDTIKAAMLYKDKHGRKMVALATDGTQEGKMHLARMVKEEDSQQRSYTELSARALVFYKKMLGEEGLDAVTTPSREAVKILKLNPDEYKIISDTEYQRLFQGEWITKRMVGFIGKDMY